MAVPEEQVLVLTRWAHRWLTYGLKVMVGRTPSQDVARRLVHAFDEEQNHPDDYVVDHLTHLSVIEDVAQVEPKVTDAEIVEPSPSPRVKKVKVDNKKKTQKLAKGKRSCFAMAVAKRAYFKFGARPVSDANVLVTRKWITKLLDDEYPDLRTCDKIIAVDRATFLSFIPTMSWNNIKFLVNEDGNAMTNRISGRSVFSRIAFWANPAK
jgi:hypothetical protein